MATAGPIELPWLLQAWRSEVAGLTQAEAKEALYLASRGSLSGWETGARPVPIDRLRDIDECYGAGGTLVDLAMALGTPAALPARRTWTHNFSGSGGPVWMWLRPTPGAGKVVATARWAAFAYDCAELCDDRGIFGVAPASMPNPALWVELPEPGWVDFGEGVLPPQLGLRTIEAMSVARVVGDGHSPAGLVAPHIVDRFLDDAGFAADVLDFFGGGPDVVREVFSASEGWGRIDDLTASAAAGAPGRAGQQFFTGRQYRQLRAGRGLSQPDAAELATELLPDERDRRGRLQKVTVEHIRSIEGDRSPRPRYLRSRLDSVYRADGRTFVEAVAAEPGGPPFVFAFPRFWVGPVWFTFSCGDDRDAAVRIDSPPSYKRMRIADGVSVTCRRPALDSPPFVITCPAGWHVTGGMGLLDQAADINLGWHAEPEPDREASVNPLFLGQFRRTLAEWDEFLVNAAAAGTRRDRRSCRSG
jgi:hypothetical protein